MRLIVGLGVLLAALGLVLVVVFFGGQEDEALEAARRRSSETEEVLPRRAPPVRPEVGERSVVTSEDAGSASASVAEPAAPAPPRERRTLLRGRLRARSGADLEGIAAFVEPELAAADEQGTSLGAVGSQGVFEFPVPPGLPQELVFRDPWGGVLHRSRILALAEGEVRDLGEILVETSLVALEVRLQYLPSLEGRRGFIEAVPVGGREAFARAEVELAPDEAGESRPSELPVTRAHRLLVPALPVELRTLVNGVRLLRYGIDRDSVLVALRPGIERTVELELPEPPPRDSRLVVEFHLDEEGGIGDELVVANQARPFRVFLPEFGDYRLALRVDRPFDALDDKGGDSTSILAGAFQVETVRVAPDDLDPIRLEPSEKALMALRALREQVR